MKRRIWLPFVATLCLSALPAQARGPMPQQLPTAISNAVGVCLDLIEGNTPRQLGQFKKTKTGYARAFAEDAPGVLDSKFRLNGSNQPRVDIYFKPDRVCDISMVRLDGGYKKHFAQIRAAFTRRGWTYTRGESAGMTKGNRVISTNGATTRRDRSGDVYVNVAIIEWVRQGQKGLKRRY